MKSTCRILIVEDELIARQALRYIIGLEKERYEIVGESSNGEEALDKMETLKPDVVITDIVMPVMGGVELVKQINIRYPNIYVIVISGHDKFDYVKSTFQFGAVDYILKPQLEPELLLNKLNNISKKLNIEIEPKEESTEYILSKLLTDKNCYMKSKEWSKYFPQKCFSLLACSFPTTSGSNINKENIIFDIIINTIKDTLSDTDCYYIVHNQHFQLLIMLNYGTGGYETMPAKILSIADDVAMSIPSVFFAMSDEYYNILETYDYAMNLRQLIDAQFYLKDHKIVFERDIVIDNTSPILDSREFIDNIRLLSIDKASDTLLKFINAAKETKNIRPRSLKKTLENTIYNTINTLEEMGLLDHELNTKKMEFLTQIGNAKNIDELIETVETILNFIETKIVKNKKISDELFYEILEYINRNYSKDVTLNTISSKFHISYSYLSSYFSEHANKGFNEYLNEVRIKRAKELLISTDNRIADISEAVGYLNQSYFGKVFRKTIGISPSVYRRRYKKI